MFENIRPKDEVNPPSLQAVIRSKRKRKITHRVLISLIVPLSIIVYVQCNIINDKNEIIAELQKEITDTTVFYKAAEQDLEIAMDKVHSLKRLANSSYRVKVTGYHPDSGGINSDSDPSNTATMTPHKAGYTCAISTELVEAGWLGKEIYIEGFGMFLANDRLNKNIKGKQIDICKGSKKAALRVGVNNGVLSTVVSRKFINEKIGGK